MKTMVPESSIDLLVAHMRQRQVDVLRRAQERRMALYAQASREQPPMTRDFERDDDGENHSRGVHTFSLV